MLQDSITTDLASGLDLRIVSMQYFDDLKLSETKKCKLYTAVCWSKEKISPKILKEKLDSVRNLTINQKTPLRVLHRRSMMVRQKLVMRLKAEYINPHFFVRILL